jgi:diguanylate cyclase (GGDEF)-like protein
MALLNWLQSPRGVRIQPYILPTFLTLLSAGLLFVVPPSSGFPPISPLLFLPLLLATLECKFEFVVLLGFVLSAALVGAEMRMHDAYASSAEFADHIVNASMRGLVFNAVAIFAGLYARQVHAKQEAIHRRLKEADDLLNLSLWINTSNSLEDTVDIVLLALRQIKPYYVSALFLRDETPSLLVACGASGAEGELKYSRLSLDAAGVGGQDGSFRTVYVNNAEQSHGLPLARLVPKVRSFAIIPLLLPDNQLIGVLYIGFDQTDALTPNDVQMVEDFALRVAFPLHKTRQQERLQGMAYSDAMTGLKNYRAFRSHLDEEMRRAARYKHSISLLLLDIDFFKQVNDRYGHQMGDRILAHIGSVIRASVRDTDLPARYGGEEFVVLCPETGAADASVVAERIRAAVQNTPFLDGQEGPLPITISIGSATYPTDAEDEATLIHHADAALYRAKHAGRNCVVLASHGETAIVDAELLARSEQTEEEPEVETIQE